MEGQICVFAQEQRTMCYIIILLGNAKKRRIRERQKMLDDHTPINWQWVVVAIPFLLLPIAFICVIIACPLLRSPAYSHGSLAGGLRGNCIFIVQISHQQGRSEQIEVYTDHSATRAFFPLQQPTAYSKIVLSPEMWTELDALRQQWCNDRPKFKKPADQAATYEIAVQCGRPLNPVIQVPIDVLPHVCTTLEATVPPIP